MSVLGERLRKARELKRLSQIEVYRRTGINNKTLSRYENGGTEPDMQSLDTLAKLYDVSVDWLFGKDVVVEKKTQYIVDPRKKRILDAIEKMAPEDVDYVLGLIERFKK